MAVSQLHCSAPKVAQGEAETAPLQLTQQVDSVRASVLLQHILAVMLAVHLEPQVARR